MRFRDLLDAHKKDLAKIVTQEHGKTLADAEGSITRGIEVVEFATGIPHLLKGEYSENVGTDVDSWSLRQPLGVCAGITPFNFPAMVPMWMFPIAIACGNTFVLKPSERDPTLSLRLARAAAAKRVCRTACSTSCTATRKRSTRCCATRRSQAMSFVGSTPIAQVHLRDGRAHGKRVQALGGAKNHAVVHARCRSRLRRPRRSSAPATAPPASAAWRSRPSLPSATSPTRCVERLATRARQ